MIYKYFYRIIQKSIELIISTKKNFSKSLALLIQNTNFDEIYDIGGSDGELLEELDIKNKRYFCLDIDSHNISVGKKKYKNNKNIFLINKHIDFIKLKNNKRKKLFIFKGVFHHLTDLEIKNFLKKIKNDSVISIDPFYHENQKKISVLLKKLDKGNYIRDFWGYHKILGGFSYKKKIDYYLKFYSHVLFYKKINKKLINRYFNGN